MELCTELSTGVDRYCSNNGELVSSPLTKIKVKERKVDLMKLQVRRFTNTELRERRRSLRAQLAESLGMEEPTDDALKELAWSGGFTYDQRDVYDELRRVESLLGER